MKYNKIIMIIIMGTIYLNNSQLHATLHIIQ